MRRLLGGIATAAFILAISLGHGSPTAMATVDSSWSALVGDSDLAAFEEKAQAAGALGFYRDDTTASLVVLIPAGTGAGFDLADLGPAPVPVTVKYSAIDPKALETARQDLEALGPVQLGATETMAFFFNPKHEKIEVHTSLDAAKLSSLLGGSWGIIDYHSSGVVDAGRFNDNAPFWGGAAIDFENWGYPDWDCTSGFTVVNGSGRRGLVTAAHCGPVNNNVRTPNAGLLVGKTELKKCGPSPYNSDVQMISGATYSNKIYVGTTQAGSQGTVTEAGTPAVGANYFYSGAKTYEKANQQVLSLDGSYWSSSCGTTFWVLNLIVWSRSGACDVRQGDSGGPFYWKYGGSPPSIGIRGMVNAYTADLTTCFGMKYTRIRDLLGYSILTTP